VEGQQVAAVGRVSGQAGSFWLSKSILEDRGARLIEILASPSYRDDLELKNRRVTFYEAINYG
jgi:hypothetical protein